MILKSQHLKLLASDIFYYFHKQDNPPADEIFVPIEIIRKDDVQENCYHATVRFIVECCGRKVHSVRIKFFIDDKGKFVTTNWNYV